MVLGVCVPIADEMQSKRKSLIDLSLLRPPIRLVAHPGSSVGAARPGRLDYMDRVIFEACEQLPARFALPPPKLLMMLEPRNHLSAEDKRLTRRADRIGDHPAIPQQIGQSGRDLQDRSSMRAPFRLGPTAAIQASLQTPPARSRIASRATQIR